MKKVIGKYRNTKARNAAGCIGKSVVTKESGVKKYLRTDLAILVVLAIAMQFFSSIQSMGEEYLHGVAEGVIVSSKKGNYGSGYVNACDTWRKMAAAKAETLLEKSVAAENGDMDDLSIADLYVADQDFANSGNTNPGRATGVNGNSYEETMSAPVTNVNTEKTDTEKINAAKSDTKVTENEGISEETEDILTDEKKSETTAGNVLHLDGFVINEDGMIEICENPEFAAQDGVLILPADARCTGIGAGAFENVTWVEEIYIPANITTIAPEVFQKLEHLMYIEVDPANPVYESLEGRLYDKAGELLVSPMDR